MRDKELSYTKERAREYRKAYYLRHRDVERLRMRARLYGITPRDIQRMERKQDSKCAICKKPQGERAMAVDHDHKTGRVRGLLCAHCNTAIGFFGDDVAYLQAAIDYLSAL